VQRQLTAGAAGLTDPGAVLQRNAELHGDRVACREVDGAGELLAELTWTQLLSRARSVAARLRGLVEPGGRVLLPQSGSINFVVGVYACLEAGLIAVPAVHPRHKRRLEPLRAIAADCGAGAVLIEEADEALFDEMGSTVAVDAPFDGADGRPAQTPGPDAIALLQYTSGSTSQPKGVMIRRRNIAANAAAIVGALDVTGESSFVSWLPLYHDMGLITAIFTPALAGVSTTLMPSGAFSRSPLTWLRLIDRWRATHSGAPDFALELCARRVSAEEAASLDLSSWRSAFTGAEPIWEATLSGFAERFAPAGFDPAAYQPCYGLAETTLLASTCGPGEGATVRAFARDALREGAVRPPQDGEPARRLVACGRPPPGSVAAIVSPDTLDEVGPGQVGEIWLSGPSVGGGYWGRSAASQETFGARLGERAFLRTGDLGFLDEGDLFVCGRLKDSLILRGRTHQPHDIEAAAGVAHPELSPGEAAAFPIESGGREGFAVACALRRSAARQFDAAGIVAAVRLAVVRAAQVDPDAVVLVGPTALPRTSSGKLRRRACAQLYEAGGFEAQHHWTRSSVRPFVEPLGPAAAAPDVAVWVRRWIARHLGLPEMQIASDVPFAELGLDSMGAVELALALELAVERPLDQTLLWSAPTIRALADCIAQPPVPAAAPAAAGSRARRSALLGRLRAELSGAGG
jgi:acyl-CoA synthetase (AMP-forming)/AMP-acid ligase II/acyl carrier protein